MMLPGGVVTNYGLMEENVVIDPMHPTNIRTFIGPLADQLKYKSQFLKSKTYHPFLLLYIKEARGA